MTPDEQDQRRYWRLLWLSSIQAFGDSETQRTRWLDPAERNPHYSFVECMCCYFDDAYLGEENAYERRIEAGRLSEEEWAAVAEFHAIITQYESPSGDDWDSEAVLKDPKWQIVVDAARRAQDRLLPLLTDTAEKDALTVPLQWRERIGMFRADLTGSAIVTGGRPSLGRMVGRSLKKLLKRRREKQTTGQSRQ